MLGRTNTGGGGVGGVLTVTAPAGVTVSVSKDGKVKTKTANAEGLAVFKGLATGTWQLTITDGSQVSTKPVVITADYSTVIAFFMATIAITYPAGSICTCSDGVTTLTAPDTSGVWSCIVPNTGTWTISITNGVETAEDTVEITADGQSESVALDYTVYIYADGQLSTISGFNVDKATFKNENNRLVFQATGNVYSSASSTETINVDGYNEIAVTFDEGSWTFAGDANYGVGVSRTKIVPQHKDFLSIASYYDGDGKAEPLGEYVIDLRNGNVSGDVYLGFTFGGNSIQGGGVLYVSRIEMRR